MTSLPKDGEGRGKQMAETYTSTSSLHTGVVQQTIKEDVSTSLTDYPRKSTAQNLRGT